MRVFLSYAGEQLGIARQFHQRLVNEGHEVFFDREDLRAGTGYDASIREEIGRCDVFVFLVSPESVADGGYARTELNLIARRFARPRGRVLPVRVAPTPFESLPDYLRAITVQQEGDPIAETLAAVAQLARGRQRRRVLAAALAACVIAASLTLLPRWFRGEVVDGVRVSARVLRVQRGVLTSGDTFLLQVELRNQSTAHIRVESLAAELEDPYLHFVAPDSAEPDAIELAPDETWSGELPFRVKLPSEHRFVSHEEVQESRWRVSWEHGDAAHWTAWSTWSAQGSPQPAAARVLEAAYAGRVRALTATDKGFVYALVDPPELLISEPRSGDSAPIRLAAAPTCVAADGSTVFVGSAQNSSVTAIDVATGTTLWMETLPAMRADSSGAELATRPLSIAAAAGHVWVLTGGAGSSGTLLLRAVAGGPWRLHPVLAGSAWSDRFRLRSIDDQVWAIAAAGSEPSYVTRLTADDAVVVLPDPQQPSVPSSIRDLAPGFDTGTLLFCEPPNQLVKAGLTASARRPEEGEEARIDEHWKVLGTVDNPIRSDPRARGRSEHQRLVRCEASLFVFQWSVSTFNNSPWVLELARFDAGQSTGEVLLEAVSCGLIDAATHSGAVRFIVQDEQGATRILEIL